MLISAGSGLAPAEVDLYLADPSTVGVSPQGAHYLGTFVDNGPLDADDRIRHFDFDLSSLSYPQSGEAHFVVLSYIAVENDDTLYGMSDYSEPYAVLLESTQDDDNSAGPSLQDGTITVNSSANTNEADSQLTLVEAIMLANGELTRDLTSAEQQQVMGMLKTATIVFDIPTEITLQVIEVPDGGLPPIVASNVTIDGYTQPGLL